jgi:hypothetical protein
MLRFVGRTMSIVVAWCLCATVTLAQTADLGPARPPADPVATLSFDEPALRNVDGWRETGRTSGVQADGRIASLGSPAPVGDRLVSVGAVCEPGETACEAVGWSSADGTEWDAVPLPGEAPTVRATAAAPGRMVAVGQVGGDERVGAVWVTTDGSDWAMAAAAPPRFTKDVAVNDETIALLAMKRVWTSPDGAAWTEAEGPHDVRGVEAGPGGFIAWTGGHLSKGVYVRAQAWRSPDGNAWTEIGLPDPLGQLEPRRAALDLFPLDDEWIMAPPKRTLYRSSDGVSWEPARDRSQYFQYPIDWIIRIGDHYHAFGQYHPARAMFAWHWGGADRPDNLWTDEVMHRPMTWQGESIGFGQIESARGDPLQVAWRWEGLPAIPGFEAFGLEVLSRNGPTPAYGSDAVDVLVRDDGLVAVGAKGDRRGPGGAAWSSPDGRSWKRTHLLPRGTSLATAVPLGNGSLLAFGERWSADGPYLGAWTWRLEPGGSIGPAQHLPSRGGCCQAPIGVAGSAGTGLVALLGERLAVDVKRPGQRWAAATLPEAQDHRSVGVVKTRSGFVVVANSPAGISAWRSEDGRTWHGPELLAGSRLSHDRPDIAAAEDVVYDEKRDILLVVAYPDRVWRSEAGGPFEPTGPLAIAVSDPAVNDGVLRGIALDDGFLIAVSDSPLGIRRTRLQTSADGRSWTPAPLMQVDVGETDLVVHHDRLLFFGGSPDVIAGPASISDYPEWPIDVTP